MRERRIRGPERGLALALMLSCSHHRRDPAEGGVPQAHREPLSAQPPTASASAAPAPTASASAAPASSAPAVRGCAPGERLDRGCDCSGGRACFDICCSLAQGCAHPLRPGGPSACLLRPLAAAPAPPAPRLVFACGDKHAGPSCDEAAWLPTQAASEGAGLLAHAEGGPEGAVWNGDAALWLGVPEGARSVSFGGPLGEGQAAEGRRWYRVGPALWRKRLRAVPGKPYQAIDLVIDGRVVGAFRFAEGE